MSRGLTRSRMFAKGVGAAAAPGGSVAFVDITGSANDNASLDAALDAKLGTPIAMTVVQARAAMVATTLIPGQLYNITNAHAGQASIFIRARTTSAFEKSGFGTLLCTTNGITWASAIQCTMFYNISAVLDEVVRFIDPISKNDVTGNFSQFDWSNPLCVRNTILGVAITVGSGAGTTIHPTLSDNLLVGPGTINFTTQAAGAVKSISGCFSYGLNGTSSISGVGSYMYNTKLSDSCIITLSGADAFIANSNISYSTITVSGASSSVRNSTINTTSTVTISGANSSISDCDFRANNGATIRIYEEGSSIKRTSIVNCDREITLNIGVNTTAATHIEDCEIKNLLGIAANRVRLYSGQTLKKAMVDGVAVDLTTWDAGGLNTGVLDISRGKISPTENTLTYPDLFDTNGITNLNLSAAGLDWVGIINLNNSGGGIETINTITTASPMIRLQPDASLTSLTIDDTNPLTAAFQIATKGGGDKVLVGRADLNGDWIQFRSSTLGCMIEENSGIYI